jgi:hypothetical protein
VGGLDGGAFERVFDTCGGVEIPLAVGAAEHGVDEGRGRAQARGVDEVDRLVDGGARRDARQEAQLVEPEPQGEAHGRVERRGFARGEVCREAVEPRLAAQDAEHQLITEPAVFPGEVDGGQQRRGERALPLDPPQNLEGRRPRRRDDARAALPFTLPAPLNDANTPAHFNDSTSDRLRRGRARPCPDGNERIN